MCSTPVERITRAIDELAAQAETTLACDASSSGTEEVVARLAELWALLAELDPEVARRLPIYEA